MFLRVRAEAWRAPPSLGILQREGASPWAETPRTFHLSGKHQGHVLDLPRTLTPDKPVSHPPP